MTTNDFLMSIDVSTRSKRRRATSFVVDLLERVHSAEYANLDRFPLNLQNGDAFANAECSLEVIADAIVCLADAY